MIKLENVENIIHLEKLEKWFLKYFLKQQEFLLEKHLN